MTVFSTTPFVVPSEKIRIHLRGKTNYCVKLHSLATKNDQVQERFLHFNQHSITILDILMRQSSYQRKNILSFPLTFESVTPS